MRRIFALVLMLALLVPVGLPAAAQEIQPYASDYLNYANGYTVSVGSGKVNIQFYISGTSTMSDIGALSIQLYESTNNSTWTRVKTFNSSVYSNMMGHNVSSYNSYVQYQGVAGRYYKAYVCAWASKNGDGGSRYFWTASVQAG